jgi:hypothetical protein
MATTMTPKASLHERIIEEARSEPRLCQGVVHGDAQTRPAANVREAAINQSGRFADGGLAFSAAVLGNAAEKILRGQIGPNELPGMIDRCHWCNKVVGRCWAGTPTCWHLAARMLIAQGLRPLAPLSGEESALSLAAAGESWWPGKKPHL